MANLKQGTIAITATNLAGPWEFLDILRPLKEAGFIVLHKHWSKGTAMALITPERPARDECEGEDCPCYQRGYEDRSTEDDERQPQERD